MLGFLAAALPAATGLASNLVTNAVQARQNRRNAQWQLDEQRKIQQEQRIYDSPRSQMSRYSEGGLNPHLIYGYSGS